MLVYRVSGFTIGHTITLVGGFFGYAPSGAWFIPAVELGIALSIIYAAITAVTNRGEISSFLITTCIGLLHGLGFSFVLHEILKVDSPNLWVSLISFNGTSVSAMPARLRDRFRADHIGFIFQMFNLVPYLSVIDNVTLPCRFSRRRRERAEMRSATPDAEAHRLLGLLGLDRGELVGRVVTDLSIGQQQRVAAARALIGDPELIIADEPTSALDEGTRERFLGLLYAQCAEAGASLLFASHDTRLGGLFDRHVSLADLQHGGSGQIG